MAISADLGPGLPLRLRAPAPGWELTADVCVVGSGVAGLCVALHARAAGLSVAVVTKVEVDDGSTRWAQGGIAAVLDPADTPAAHARDTEVAGVGLCDADAVQALVTEGPERLHQLISWGAAFDRGPTGRLLLTREGGHSTDRIVHAGGDATGAEVQRALRDAVAADPGVTLVEHAMVLDLLRDADGRTAGVTLHVLGEGSADGVGAVRSRAVVLATGGMGQVYAATTNPAVSTGDGVALGLRAGAVASDLEFVQFHPTALYLGPGARGQQPLVSEALRGEGAVLRDDAGERFMPAVHPLAELAPRDVVAKAVTRVQLRDGVDHVWLDARGLPGLAERFPTIVARCREAGIDPVTELVPVTPAAHYASGGLATDLTGRTTVPGLYACGEVACTGVHGANRLASNSLLEGLVFAGRIGAALARDLPVPAAAAPEDPRPAGLVDVAARAPLTTTMSARVGALRSGPGLAEAAEQLTTLGEWTTAVPGVPGWETTDLLTVATAITAAAAARQETRGCHWREDHPEAVEDWEVHLDVQLADDGRVRLARRSVGTPVSVDW
ncbi:MULTISPECIES: L-aspartate oxidase [unclassified Modestobacter]|uniref:L-aspartate oxidase n=1 Tax=unclassified Modestobacter TaxID=2643866 RepID=UPI0022AA241B|nr:MULTISPECIES: L-aspartate oxidase [unclassified Modestobacter]MCZ2825333.1 L-aspartate oxidase [Modestobacter sp. VKM Ac-2981]MCZ2853602.1 L-aspartate oxidase [Modestobacter sp. VKM Ac-2982]